MKKYFGLIILGLFLLVGCSQPTNNNEGQYYEYTNKEKGYSFNLDRPEGWDEVNRGRAMASFVPEMDQTMAVEKFSIYVDDLRDDPMSFDDYSQMYKGLLTDASLIDEQIEETDMSLVGTSVKKIVYIDSVQDEEGNESQRVKTQEIWGMMDQVVFSLVYHAEEERFDEYIDLINKAIETFEFKLDEKKMEY